MERLPRRSGPAGGIRVWWETQGTLVAGNVSERNGEHGIEVVFAEGVTLTSNRATDNGGWGILVSGTVIDGGGNTAVGNVLGQCSGVDCSVHDRVLLVAGNDSPPPNDRAIRDRVVAAGFDVEIVDDDRLDEVVLDDVAAVLISSSVVPDKVGDTFRSAPVPVIVWEAYLFDELALVADGSQGGETTKTWGSIVIAESTHPLAAGFAEGPVAVYTTPERLSYGRPAPAAEVVAHEPGHQQKAVIFAYGAGAPLADGSSAPAVRVALFPDYAGAGVLTQQGIDLVDAALAWALPTV